MNEDELQEKLAESRKELFNLRFQEAIGSLENTTRLRITRREIARIMTVQQEQAQAAKAQV